MTLLATCTAQRPYANGVVHLFVIGTEETLCSQKAADYVTRSKVGVADATCRRCLMRARERYLSELLVEARA